jgi:hypothetical protein
MSSPKYIAVVIFLNLLYSCKSNKTLVPCENQELMAKGIIESFQDEEQQWLSPSWTVRDQKKSLSFLTRMNQEKAKKDTQVDWIYFYDSCKGRNFSIHDYFHIDNRKSVKSAGRYVQDEFGNQFRWDADFRGDTIYRLELVAYSEKFKGNLNWSEAYFFEDSTIIFGLPKYKKLLLEKKKFILDTLIKKFKKRSLN